MSDAYEAAGVSLTSGAETIQRISAAVKSTHDERVVSGIGGFGGVFDLASLAGIEDPLLVASTDGVGTKTKLSAFFLDTVAAQHLDPEIVGRIVDGMVAACKVSNCILLGGETAEMPGVFTDGAVDIAGTMVGAVSRSKLLPKEGIEADQVLIGVASSGLHTNGYSLARKVAGDQPLTNPLPGGDGVSIGDALCAPHRNYHGVLADVIEQDLVLAMAHITGGGMQDNLPRVLPDGVGAVVDVAAWERPPLFQWLIEAAGLGIDEAHQIFNCGIGMVLIAQRETADAVQAAIAEPTWVIGHTVAHDGLSDRVQLVNS